MEHIKVLLVGGPANVPESERIHEVSTLFDRIKLFRGNGYEHFLYSGESRVLDGLSLPVFRWCFRTKLAE